MFLRAHDHDPEHRRHFTDSGSLRPGRRTGISKAGSMALTAKQLKHLETRLLEERARVVNALAQYHRETSETLQEASGDVSAYHVHMADQGTDTEDQELDAVNAQRESVELAEINAALERLYQKPAQYGRCERTGKPIPFERLDLVPWARTCD